MSSRPGQVHDPFRTVRGDGVEPLKIAYEFLALHLGTAVYTDAPPLAELRKVLRQGVENHTCFSVERLTASDYKPFHGLVFEGNDPYAKVLIRLFGWLAFRVHFKHLAVGGDRFQYTHLLDSNEVDWRKFHSAKSGP